MLYYYEKKNKRVWSSFETQLNSLDRVANVLLETSKATAFHESSGATVRIELQKCARCTWSPKRAERNEY